MADGVREKLASALMMQQVLVAERDHALQQSRLSQQRAESLQQQLDSLHTLHSEHSDGCNLRL